MDKIAKDYKFFRDHFYPEKESELTSVKLCPFCGNKNCKSIDENRVCIRCGRVWEDK